MKKRILAMLLALTLAAGLLPATSAAASDKGFETAKVAVKYFNQKAKADAFGFDADWCGYFLFRCAEEAGESAAMGGYAGQVGNVYNAANWFATNAAQLGIFNDSTLHDIQQYCNKNWGFCNVNSNHRISITDYMPQIGDIVFYDWNSGGTDIDHVEIVTDVRGRVIFTIGGNRHSEDWRSSWVDGQECNLDTTSLITAFARPNYSSTNPPQEPVDPVTPPTNTTTKTQYRYHRYENGDGSDYFVCAYLGLSYYPSMRLVYSDWVDTPYPEVKKGYVNYLEHPHQGGCESAGCLASDPFEVHRHVAPDGKVWYYEETRQVTVEQEDGQTSPSDDTAKPEQPSTPEVPPADPTTPSLAGRFPPAKTYREGMFSDVSAAHWFAGNVETAYELALMEGVGSGRFAPDNSVTLAQAVTMAARIHKIYHSGSDDFPRYDGGNWYDPYVDYARDEGIIYENYAYNRPATREEFCHILAAALPKEELEALSQKADFADQGDIIYRDDVALLQATGVIDGIREDGKLFFKPWSTVTRAQAAAILTRMVDPSLRRG